MKLKPHKSERLAWKNAKDRCLNPNHQAWRNYGGRGITFHPPWIKDFDAFLAHVGPKPPGTDLDRIDNNSGYVPGNLRWVTRSRNTRNKRFCPLVAAFLRRIGKYDSLADLSEACGLSSAALRYRVVSGIPDHLVTEPVFSENILNDAVRRHGPRKVTHKTSTGLTVSEACKLSGVKLATAYKRINKYGRTVDEAVK